MGNVHDVSESNCNPNGNSDPHCDGEHHGYHPKPDCPPVISPAHGRIDDPISRAQFALNNGWISGHLPNEMEGGKNFPRDDYTPLIWFAIEARG